MSVPGPNDMKTFPADLVPSLQPSYDCILPSGERGIVVKRSATCVAAVVALSISTLATSAEPKAGVDKLYILNCGEGVAGLHERRDQTARLKLDAT